MKIDGRALAQDLNLHTQARINKLSSRPLLVDIVVGADPASLSYVGIKQRTAKKFGMDFEAVELPEQSSTEQVITKIQEISARPELCGLIVQVPLPKHLDQQAILDSIPIAVDVDLLNQESAKKFYNTNSSTLKDSLIPPTAAAILYILDSLSEDWKSKKFLVVGRGELVGKPVAFLLKQRGLNVEVAHTQTTNTEELLQTSDVIISGVGKSGFITGDKIKDGVIIIDAGTSEANGTIAGDVDFISCELKAKYITPVPGGVGPLTVAKLLENVLIVVENK